MTDRLDRIEELLGRFIEFSLEDRAASNERMTRIERQLQESTVASNERLTRIERSVESNNRF